MIKSRAEGLANLATSYALGKVAGHQVLGVQTGIDGLTCPRGLVQPLLSNVGYLALNIPLLFSSLSSIQFSSRLVFPTVFDHLPQNPDEVPSECSNSLVMRLTLRPLFVVVSPRLWDTGHMSDDTGHQRQLAAGVNAPGLFGFVSYPRTLIQGRHPGIHGEPRF